MLERFKKLRSFGGVAALSLSLFGIHPLKAAERVSPQDNTPPQAPLGLAKAEGDVVGEAKRQPGPKDPRISRKFTVGFIKDELSMLLDDLSLQEGQTVATQSLAFSASIYSRLSATAGGPRELAPALLRNEVALAYAGVLYQVADATISPVKKNNIRSAQFASLLRAPFSKDGFALEKLHNVFVMHSGELAHCVTSVRAAKWVEVRGRYSEDYNPEDLDLTRSADYAATLLRWREALENALKSTRDNSGVLGDRELAEFKSALGQVIDGL